MRRCTRLFTVAMLTTAFSITRAIAGAAGTDCAALTGLAIPDVKLTAATAVPAGPFVLPGGRGGSPPITVPRSAALWPWPRRRQIRRSISRSGFRPPRHGTASSRAWVPEGSPVRSPTGRWPKVFGEVMRRSQRTWGTPETICCSATGTREIVDWGMAVHVVTEAGKLIVRNHAGLLSDTQRRRLRQ